MLVHKGLVLGFATTAAVANAQINPSSELLPGAWSETVIARISTISDKPASTPPLIQNTETDCYTSEDVADPKRILLAGAEKECSISKISMTDGKISMSIACVFGSGVMLAGDMHGSYSSTALNLKGMLRAQGNATLELDASMTARRVGVCR